jgi:hypothetical protein
MMHLCRTWIALGLLAVVAGSLPLRAAVVYKWVDADGVVHFSDQPVPGAEKIVTATGTSRGGASLSTYPGSSPPKAKGTATPLNFEEFAITSPGKEETITGNQPVNVHLALQPQLKPTQSITWFLNGSALSSQAPDATQFTLEDLPRGTYTIGATVMDQSSGESKSADSVTFYVVRTSLFAPGRKGGT